MYTHQKNIIQEGRPLQEAEKALIMVHGRGATAASILSLSKHLQLENTAFLAPQATQHSWYPYSFMAPLKDNQPALDSALALLEDLVGDIIAAGIPQEQIFFLGFSQGACLSLEYVARHAGPYGGVVALTGGLIGERIFNEHYSGDFQHSPVLITTGDPDPHVPVSRVVESVSVLEQLNAEVSSKIYKGRPHTIQAEELALANSVIFNPSAK